MTNPLYQKYANHYREFAKITDMNLAERAKQIPAEKHFWAEKLIDAKIHLKKLQKMRGLLLAGATEKAVSKSPVRLDKSAILNSDAIEKNSDDIEDQELLISFLTLTMNNITYIAQDIKNIILLNQMENE